MCPPPPLRLKTEIKKGEKTDWEGKKVIEKGEKEGYIRKNVKFFPKVRQFCNLGGGAQKHFVCAV